VKTTGHARRGIQVIFRREKERFSIMGMQGRRGEVPTLEKKGVGKKRL